MKKLVVLVALLTAFLLTGCATIVNGTTTNLTVNSNVPQAKIYVNGMYRGNTPAVLNLPKGDQSFVVTVEAPGYRTYTTIIDREVSEWVWGNLLSWSLVGILVDFATGGVYVYNNDTVFGYLDKVKVGELKRQ